MAIADYKERVFFSVYLKDRVVDRNMRPKSEALRNLLAAACQQDDVHQ